jgi:hypothetical protein
MMGITYGNVAQWVSAGVAVVVVLAAIKLLMHGRRTNISVDAEPFEVGGTHVLDVSITLSPVGSFRVTPYWAAPCVACPVEIPNEMFYESWTTSKRCGAENRATDFSERDFHVFAKFRRKRKGMTNRRRKWGCTNRKVPTIEVREVRIADAESGERSVTDRAVRYVFNAFDSEFSEPQERLERTHAIVIPPPEQDVIGWRVQLQVCIPREWWSFKRPNDDSWSWTVDSFVPRTAVKHLSDKA